MSKKILKGKIVSDKMQKNVVVQVDTVKKHPIYGKNMTITKKFKALNTAQGALGQFVEIQETRPIAKTVTWEVVKVL